VGFSSVSAQIPDSKSPVKPKIVFSEFDFDFGKNFTGKTLEHSFTFKNDGDAPLFIEKVKAG